MTLLVAEAPAKPSFPAIWERIVARAEALKLDAGQPLPAVRELAEQMALKPSVVRDALLQAQAKGAVRIVPRVGAFLAVAPAEALQLVCGDRAAGNPAWTTLFGGRPQNILHVLDARRLIEVELIGRAAAQRRLEDLLPARRTLEAMQNLPSDASRAEYIALDYRFHAELARSAGNDVLLSLQQAFHDRAMAHFAELPANLEQRSFSNRDHAAIYAAVAEGDVEQARRVMHEHVSTAYDYLMSTLSYPPAAK